MTLNLLMSFPHVTKNDLDALAGIVPADTRVLYDSGAFTVWTKGITIEVADYCEFLSSTPLKPWRYFTLDAIGDPKQTRRNYEQLRERGLDPVPIVTVGTDPLDDFLYYGQTADVIALGGLLSMGQHPGRWIAHCYERLKEAPSVGVHLLGKTTGQLIARYRPYSVDSSSWDTAGRYGTFSLYVGGGKMLTMRRSDILGLTSVMKQLIREHAVEPRDLLQSTAWRGGRGETGIASAAAYIKYAADVEDRYGTKLFLAAVGNRAKVIVESYKRLEAVK